MPVIMVYFQIPKKIKEIIQKFLSLVHNQLSDVRSVNTGGAELLEAAGIFSCQVCVENFLGQD